MMELDGNARRALPFPPKAGSVPVRVIFYNMLKYKDIIFISQEGWRKRPLKGGIFLLFCLKMERVWVAWGGKGHTSLYNSLVLLMKLKYTKMFFSSIMEGIKQHL